MGHLERKKREQKNIRGSILNAAITIAKSKGWNAVTIRKIAEAIEYSPPIVYTHFQNKDDLIREIIIQGFQKLIQTNQEYVVASKNAKKQLLALSVAHWDFAVENRELYQLMFSIERPIPNEEAERGSLLIKDIFAHVSGKEGRELDSIIFNWVCLLNGIIGMIMQFEESEHPFLEKYAVKPRDLFMQFMQRFINSIATTESLSN
ncbi:MAG: transcriptional regulator, TetR family [Bacteroidetes bacterium]|jgi:AcrR family transcriptional regulator|nr:transcriptional regulator, TetR family [Bacteroidota bacterium]